MKKVFLIFGIICTTSSYALQDGGNTASGKIDCPQGCTPAVYMGESVAFFYCQCPDGARPVSNHQTRSAVSVRSVETPKAVKKIVYEVVTDEE